MEVVRGDRLTGARGVRILLDTHFLLWTALDADRLTEFPWLDAYRPWGISPVSFLEIQFLHEVGRLALLEPGFAQAVASDRRFSVDEVPLVTLVEKALPLSWTRDPFDRLITAQAARLGASLLTRDRTIRDHYANAVW